MAKPEKPTSATKGYVDELEYDETLDDADNPLVRALYYLSHLGSDALKPISRIGPNGSRSI